MANEDLTLSCDLCVSSDRFPHRLKKHKLSLSRACQEKHWTFSRKEARHLLPNQKIFQKMVQASWKLLKMGAKLVNHMILVEKRNYTRAIQKRLSHCHKSYPMRETLKGRRRQARQLFQACNPNFRFLEVQVNYPLPKTKVNHDLTAYWICSTWIVWSWPLVGMQWL